MPNIAHDETAQRSVSGGFSLCRLRVPLSNALYCLRARTGRLMRVCVRACVSPIDLRGATPKRVRTRSRATGESA